MFRKRSSDPQLHLEMPESRPPSQGLIRSTIWSDIERVRSSDETTAAEAREKIGIYYYNSIRRVFRLLTREPSGRDDIALGLTHDFLLEKIWLADSPLFRNGEKLEKMKAEEEAGQTQRAFRAFLGRSLRNFLLTRRRSDARRSTLPMDGPEDEGGLAAVAEDDVPDEQNLNELVRTHWAEELLNEAVAGLEERDRRLVEVRLAGESWEDYAKREGKSAMAVRQAWSRRVVPNLRIRIDDLLEQEHPDQLERDAELRECLRWADRKNQLLDLLSRDANHNE